MTVLTTLSAVLFIILSFLFPELAIMILSVEIVLLPSIYMIGNECSEQLLKKEYNKNLEEIRQSIGELNEKYNNQMVLNSILRKKIKGLRNEKRTTI